MELVVVVLVALLVALVATIAVVARRRRRRRAAPAPVPVQAPPAATPTAGGEASLWPEPHTDGTLDAETADVAAAHVEVPGTSPIDDLPRRAEGWRVRVPFAEPLSVRLAAEAPDAPAELVARFDALAASAAADEVVASLAALGYEVRWRRPAELALGSPEGHVARVVVASRPEGGATVGVELEPDEVADVAVGLLDRLLTSGCRLDRREATTVVLRDPNGAAIRVTRVPTVRA
jgi:hypothetical protein